MNDMKAYNNGMAHAFRVAKTQGLEALEDEIRSRGIMRIPMNVDKKLFFETINKAIMVREDLINLALTDTLLNYLKLPQRVVEEMIPYLNSRLDELEQDKEKRKELLDAQENDYIMCEISRRYEDGNNH